MEPTVKPFVRKSLDVTTTILAVFEKRLGLPEGAFLNRHTLLEPSGSEARCIKNPAKPRPADPSRNDTTADDKLALGAHTDFGSLSFLHNRLGGLQVLTPRTAQWQYIRPIPGHAICNVGDALTILSGGILRSNMHRVVPPPGEQRYYERWSLVFFLRPGDGVDLHALTDDSKLVSDAVSRLPEEEQKTFYPNSTAGQWFTRRIKLRRTNNMKVR